MPGAVPPSDPTASRGRLILALSSLAHFVNDGTNFFVPVIAALLSPLRGFSSVEVTVLFVVYYVTSAGSGLAVGWWVDRRGRPATLMGVGIALLGTGLLGFYLTLSGLAGGIEFPVALVSGAVTGFGASFYHPLGASLLQRATPAETRGTALGINGAFGSLGRAVYPLLFFLATLSLVTQDSILFFAAVGLGTALIISLGIRQGHLQRASESTPSTSSAAKATVTGAIQRLTGVAFVRSIALQGVAVWIPTYLVASRGVAAGGDLGLAVTVMYAGGIAGQPAFGLAANSIDRRLLIGGSSAGAALATLAYLATAGPIGDGFLFLIGFFTFNAFPLLMTLSSDYVPSGSSSLANALVFGVGSGAGGTVGSLAVGWIAARGFVDLPLGLEAMAGLGFVAAALVVVLPRGKLGRPAHLFG